MTRDRFRYFRVEARELLDHLGQGVLDLEKGGAAAEVIPRMLRLAHTMKGAARVVKQAEIADRAHAAEAILATLRDSQGRATGEQIERLLALIDEMSSRVAALTVPAEPGAAATAGPTDDVFRAFRPDIHEMDGLLDTLAEARGQLSAFDPVRKRAEQARHLADLISHQVTVRVPGDARPGDRTAQQNTRALAEDLRSAVGTLERDLAVCVDQLNRDLREARAAAERLRLVPAHAVFPLLERTVRDTAQTLGKRVTFEGRGGDVRLDAHVLGVIQSALLQAVRNAAAHGIEAPTDRARAGKPVEGRVVVDVSRQGPRVVFACRDDGRGVDLEAVRSLAQQKGLMTTQTGPLSAEGLLALLLKGGISTSGSVTDISGRGVGLDVVREAAARVGGDARVRTEAGHGTTLEIVVPVTLASLRGLLVEAAGATAILPLDAVKGSVRLSTPTIARSAHGQSIAYGGEMIPLASLAHALDPSTRGRHAGDSLRTGPDRPTGRNLQPAAVVVVQGRAGAAAFSVDNILGAGDVVVRPVPALTPAAPFVAGVSLDDEGVPRLVLDPDALVAAAAGLGAVEHAPLASRRPILVVDDSLTTRMLEQSILESAGYVVEVAASGEEALDKARQTRHALFLVDIEMPGMDGFTFIEQTRSDPALRDTPSILVTSRSSDDDKKRGTQVGARAYVVKGEFDQGVLLDRIRELLAHGYDI